MKRPIFNDISPDAREFEKALANPTVRITGGINQAAFVLAIATKPLTHAKRRQREACHHPQSSRVEGLREPSVYGSWAVTICGKCGS